MDVAKTEIQTQIQALKNEALDCYRRQNYPASLQLWQKILRLDPKNSLAMLYIRRIQQSLPPAAVAAKKEEKEERHERPPAQSLKVMIVDDSAMMRKAIARILAQDPQFQVVSAKGGEEALSLIPRENPDVISLDVNMPGMDGMTTLKHIMVQYPRPVIMLSAFTEEGSAATFDCLFYGAIDFVSKPSKSDDGFEKQQENFKSKLVNAARVKVSSPNKARVIKKSSLATKDAEKRTPARWIVAIGGGEGGYNAYLKIVPYLPAKIPCAILAIQNTREEYLRAFCEYLNRTSRICVKVAGPGDRIEEGVCYFSHDGNYLKIEQTRDGPCCQITPKPTLIAQQNVVNQLLFSVGEKYGAHSIGVLLSGAGMDGIEGLKELKRTHGITLVQDPRTCLVPQTVNYAIDARCADQTVVDSDIVAMVWHILKSKGLA